VQARGHVSLPAQRDRDLARAARRASIFGITLAAHRLFGDSCQLFSATRPECNRPIGLSGKESVSCFWPQIQKEISSCDASC
jgi:hypothetical protein